MNKSRRKLYAKILLGCLSGLYMQMFMNVLPIFAQESLFNISASLSQDNILSYAPTYDNSVVEDSLTKEVIWAKNCNFDGLNEYVYENPESFSCEILDQNSADEYLITENNYGEYFVLVKFAYEEDSETTFYYSSDSVSYSVPVSLTVDLDYDGFGSLVSTPVLENYEGGDLPEYSYEWYRDCNFDINLKPLWETCDLLENNSSTLIPEYSLTNSVYYSKVNVLDEQENYYSAYDEISVSFPRIDNSQFLDLERRAGERFSMIYNDINKEIVQIDAVLDGEELIVTRNGNEWTLLGREELTFAKEMKLQVTAYNSGGFSGSYETVINVLPGIIDLASSALSVTFENSPAEYVKVDSGELDIVFQSYDRYGNKININNLSRVNVYLNDTLLEGVDFVGSDIYRVKRTAIVPTEENLSSQVIVDVFSEECKGVLGNQVNYCFSKTYDFSIYNSNVKSLENLVYETRTNESSITVSGNKLSGYGVKLNSTDIDFIVEPNDSTIFSFELPLAEGKNFAKIYSVKVIGDNLEFYSDPAEITVVKDTYVTGISWNSPAITLDGDNQATLHWTDPIYFSELDFDFAYVNIYRSTVPNFVPNESNLIVQTHNPEWIDTGLNSGSNYYYAIEAVDALGNTSLLSEVMASGQILGESATIVSSITESENEYVGKGYGEDVTVDESVLDEEESKTSDEDDVISEENEVVGEDDSGETLGSRFAQFWNNFKDSASTVFVNVTGNIFVQICVGGVLIFVGLMLLISILVWLKEKIIDARLVSLEEDESKDSNSSKK